MSSERVLKVQCDFCGNWQYFNSRKRVETARKFLKKHCLWLTKEIGLFNRRTLDFCSQECLNNYNEENK